MKPPTYKKRTGKGKVLTDEIKSKLTVVKSFIGNEKTITTA